MRVIAILTVACAIAMTASSTRAEDAGAAPSAVERMSKPGPEAEQLAHRAGVWTVVATLWPAPGAKPIVTKTLIAERTMIGPFLQEIMHPAPGSSVPDFRRIAYLSYDRVEGGWKYVSMDTRFPAGIMPAWSFGGEQDGRLTLQFEPLGFVGFGSEVEGRLTRSDFVITRKGKDHEIAQQHFLQADGTGTRWLAVQYEYKRLR